MVLSGAVCNNGPTFRDPREGRFAAKTQDKTRIPKHYLFASDSDKTLSYNDSGIILSEILGTAGFQEKVDGLSLVSGRGEKSSLWWLGEEDSNPR